MIVTTLIIRTHLMCGTTILLPMIGLNSYPGYHPWSPGYGIGTFKSAGSTMWGNGSQKRRNSECGMTRAGKVKAIGQSCFVMEIPVSARHLSGNKDCTGERKKSKC